MKKTVLILAFLMPFLVNAQSFDSWRIATHLFLPSAIVENIEGVHKPRAMISTVQPLVSYGLSGEIVFSISNKLKFATGIGFEFKNYTEKIDNSFSRNDNGSFQLQTGYIDARNQLSLFIPLRIIYPIGDKSAIEVGINPNFRLNKKVDIYTTELDGSNREAFILNSQLQLQIVNLNLQAAFCYKMPFGENKNFLIKPYIGYFILKDGLWLNYGNNHFVEGGLSLGIEFGKSGTTETKKKVKRRGR
jgi:hypothetical protein